MYNNIRYYFNIVYTKLLRKHIIKYDKHTASPYFNKERKYAGTVIHKNDETQQYIFNKILSGKPVMIARFGSTELYNLEVFDLNIRHKYENALNMLSTNSGFFPKEYKYAHEFANLMKLSCNQVDVFGIWNMFMEEHYIKNSMQKDIYLTQLRFIEPWFGKVPWTKALKGKKVLVIHPFTDTIARQYQFRSRLFANQDILPEFELLTLRAVQTLAGEKDERFNTWFEALDYMYHEALIKDFDIALIGCGAYGLPLAAKLKESGKQAVHMGGVLQILFGIRGKRWDDDPVVSKLYNAHWVRPSENETPKRADNVENGCYW